MSIKYIKNKDIDFMKMGGCEYSTSEYLEDVPIYKVASHYLNLNHVKDKIYDYELHLKNDPEGKTHHLIINDEKNNCLLDSKPINVEKLVMILETNSLEDDENVNENIIIKNITGIDLDDYISHVWYEGGGEYYVLIDRKKLK